MPLVGCEPRGASPPILPALLGPAPPPHPPPTQAVQPPRWATEIAALLGSDTAPASGQHDPNAIRVTKQPQQPAGGVVVSKAYPSHTSPHAYVWTGPVAAGDGMPGMMRKYPMLALGLRELLLLLLWGPGEWVCRLAPYLLRCLLGLRPCKRCGPPPYLPHPLPRLHS